MNNTQGMRRSQSFSLDRLNSTNEVLGQSSLLLGRDIMNENVILIEGETFVLSGEISAVALFDEKGSFLCEGRMWITNFRIILRFYDIGEFSITHSKVINVEKLISSEYEIYNISCKDMNVESIGICLEEKRRKDVAKLINKYSLSKSTKSLFMYYHPQNIYASGKWYVFSPEVEYSRMNSSYAQDWKFLKVNAKYDLCQTYPSSILTFLDFQDSQVLRMSCFRDSGKVPFLTWLNDSNAFLLRASYPGVAFSDGITNDITKCKEDLEFMENLLRVSGKETINFYDLGSKSDSYEIYRDNYAPIIDDCAFFYMNFHSDSQLVDYFRNIYNCVTNPFKGTTVWLEEIDQIKWLDYLSKLLTNAQTIAKKLQEGEPCILISKSGGGILASLSAIAQLLIDPFYRTIDGFMVLVEKEFMFFGNNFGISNKRKDTDIYSSVFLTFCDAVSQLIHQSPYYFEFEESLLLFILDSLYSCIFGNFYCSCERERVENKISTKTPSIWAYITENKVGFQNLFYTPYDKMIPFIPDKRRIKFWTTFYLRNKSKYRVSKAVRVLQTSRKKEVPVIEFSGLNLPFLPVQPWKEYGHLKFLRLNNNLFMKFPLEISFFRNLERLHLDNNQISFIPEMVLDTLTKQAPKLKELNFNNNQLLEIPSIITQFQNLESLSVNFNLLTEIPEISSFQNLVFLDIGANKELGHIPPQILQLSSLTSLNISSNNIEQIPPALFKMNLKALNISSNLFTELDQLSQLTTLEILDISNNNLTTFPDFIYSFTLLVELNISTLSMTHIHPNISNLQGLTHLNASVNLIEVLPTEFLQLTKLKYLFLANNNLTTVPLDISKLSEMLELHLEYNQLIALSPGVGNMKNLAYLNVSHNKLRYLPASIVNLTVIAQTEQLLFEHNPKLSTPPKEAISKGMSTMMAYMKELLTESEKCYRIKLMVVGQENVGKSSLLRCLVAYNKDKKKAIANQAHLDKSLKSTGLSSLSTDGIDIGKLHYDCKFVDREKSVEETKKTKVEVSIWDFAGQEIYYTTHQFFLSERAVYLLVWNISRSEEESRVEYWLKSIYARAKNAPIIIVATHIDNPKCTKDFIEDALTAIYNKYIGQFPSIKKVIGVSCSQFVGIDELDLWIQDIIRKQHFMGELIPKSFLELEKLVKEEAIKRVPPVVSWNEFCTMGKFFQIGYDLLPVASSLLHDFGTLINFQKQKGLEDIVILHPQWLTNVMSTIITTKHSVIKNGVLQHSMLPQIWRAPDFPDYLHPTLIHLLEKFEVSYYLRSTREGNNIHSGRSLIPSLLPEERPGSIDQKWAHFPVVGELQYSRRYIFSFIPHGFISRMLVRVLHFAEPSVFWKYGMLVETSDDIFGNYSILIEAQPARKQVDVIIRGSSGARLAQLILETISSLIDGWYGLYPEIFIPCIHCVRLKMYDPYLITMEECEKAAISGKSFVKCRNNRPIRLDELVPDVAMTHVQNCKLDYSDIQLTTQIGEGDNGVVFKGNFKNNLVAVKKIKSGFSTSYTKNNTLRKGLLGTSRGQMAMNSSSSFRNVNNEDIVSEEDIKNIKTGELQAFSDFRREVWIMSGLVHQNIVQLVGFTVMPFTLVTEFIHHGNLYHLLHQNDKELSWLFRWRCAIDIAKGMNFLHTTTPPIIHRNLKTPNILISNINEKEPVLAKVTDFGLSQALASTTQGRAGANPVWLAPEILRNEEYTEKADVYSYGVVLWEIVSRKDFFGEIKNTSMIESKILKGERPPIPDNIPQIFKNVISGCWASESDDRPSFQQILDLFSDTFKQEHPDLHEIAFYNPSEDQVSSMKSEHLQSSNIVAVRKFRTKQEIEQENREMEEARKKELQEELQKISERVSIDTSIVSMEYIPGELMPLEKNQSQIWVGNSEGVITVFDESMKKIDSVQTSSAMIICLLLVGDAVWAVFSNTELKILPVRTPSRPRKIMKGSQIMSLRKSNKFVYAGSENSVSIFDFKGKLKKKIKIDDIAFSVYCDESSQILWVGSSKQIYRYNAKFKLMDTKQGHTGKINSIIEVENTIWSCSADKTIRLWKKDSGECLKILTGHTGPVYSLALVGQYVWSISWDKTVILWDSTYQLYYKDFEAHNDGVTCIVNNLSGKIIWTGSSDNSIVRWKGPF